MNRILIKTKYNREKRCFKKHHETLASDGKTNEYPNYQQRKSRIMSNWFNYNYTKAFAFFYYMTKVHTKNNQSDNLNNSEFSKIFNIRKVA